MVYRFLELNDVITNRTIMIKLMNIILEDNITQKYPDDEAEKYVDKIQGFIEEGTAIVAGAFDDSNLVGFSWAYELSIFNEKRIHINMIGVDPDYRRQGIARKLVELQIEEAQRRDVYIIEAMTTKDNENSYNWFHSMGFNDERVKVRRDLE